MKFSKYSANLSFDGHSVYSYKTRVAHVQGAELIQLGWWSVTTQKHINFAAQELGLELNRNGH